MPPVYLVRFGLMRQVGRFHADGFDSLQRGDTVVVRSERGDELGEVLTLVAGTTSSDHAAPPSNRILRPASAEDLGRAQTIARRHPDQIAACEEVFRDGHWPLELIDLEPLLDGRVVLYYLGPHHLDADGLVLALRERCGFVPYFEPIGLDTPREEEISTSGGCGSDGSCGSGGCGSDGGCGSNSHGDGCSTCAVKDLVRRRPAIPAH